VGEATVTVTVARVEPVPPTVALTPAQRQSLDSYEAINDAELKAVIKEMRDDPAKFSEQALLEKAKAYAQRELARLDEAAKKIEFPEGVAAPAWNRPAPELTSLKAIQTAMGDANDRFNGRKEEARKAQGDKEAREKEATAGAEEVRLAAAALDAYESALRGLKAGEGGVVESLPEWNVKVPNAANAALRERYSGLEALSKALQAAVGRESTADSAWEALGGGRLRGHDTLTRLAAERFLRLAPIDEIRARADSPALGGWREAPSTRAILESRAAAALREAGESFATDGTAGRWLDLFEGVDDAAPWLKANVAIRTLSRAAAGNEDGVEAAARRALEALSGMEGVEAQRGAIEGFIRPVSRRPSFVEAVAASLPLRKGFTSTRVSAEPGPVTLIGPGGVEMSFLPATIAEDRVVMLGTDEVSVAAAGPLWTALDEATRAEAATERNKSQMAPPLATWTVRTSGQPLKSEVQPLDELQKRNRALHDDLIRTMTPPGAMPLNHLSFTEADAWATAGGFRLPTEAEAAAAAANSSGVANLRDATFHDRYLEPWRTTEGGKQPWGPITLRPYDRRLRKPPITRGTEWPAQPLSTPDGVVFARPTGGSDRGFRDLRGNLAEFVRAADGTPSVWGGSFMSIDDQPATLTGRWVDESFGDVGLRLAFDVTMASVQEAPSRSSLERLQPVLPPR
jgi:hypothetical protein